MRDMERQREQVRASQRRLRERRKALGVCADCAAPSERYARCSKCRRDRAARKAAAKLAA